MRKRHCGELYRENGKTKMTKIMCLGAVVFALSTLASVSLTPPVVVAWDAARHQSHVIVLDTIEIVGKVPTMCVEVASR